MARQDSFLQSLKTEPHFLPTEERRLKTPVIESQQIDSIQTSNRPFKRHSNNKILKYLFLLHLKSIEIHFGNMERQFLLVVSFICPRKHNEGNLWTTKNNIVPADWSHQHGKTECDKNRKVKTRYSLLFILTCSFVGLKTMFNALIPYDECMRVCISVDIDIYIVPRQCETHLYKRKHHINITVSRTSEFLHKMWKNFLWYSCRIRLGDEVDGKNMYEESAQSMHTNSLEYSLFLSF